MHSNNSRAALGPQLFNGLTLRRAGHRPPLGMVKANREDQ